MALNLEKGHFLPFVGQTWAILMLIYPSTPCQAFAVGGINLFFFRTALLFPSPYKIIFEIKCTNPHPSHPTMVWIVFLLPLSFQNNHYRRIVLSLTWLISKLEIIDGNRIMNSNLQKNKEHLHLLWPQNYCYHWHFSHFLNHFCVLCCQKVYIANKAFENSLDFVFTALLSKMCLLRIGKISPKYIFPSKWFQEK